MNEKQKRFADEYIKTLNTVQAAKKVGYSNSAAYKLMKIDEVKDYINQNLISMNDEVIASSKKIVSTIVLIMEDANASNKDRLKAAELLQKINAAAEKAKDEEFTPVIVISGENDLKD